MEERLNTRNFTRMGLRNLHVQIMAFPEDKSEKSVVINNISLGGISILSKEPLKINEKLGLSLNVAKNQTVQAIIKWESKVNDQFQYGLEFAAVNGNEVETVKDFMQTLLNMLTKEKVIAKTIELFCSSMTSKPPFSV